MTLTSQQAIEQLMKIIVPDNCDSKLEKYIRDAIKLLMDLNYYEREEHSLKSLLQVKTALSDKYGTNFET